MSDLKLVPHPMDDAFKPSAAELELHGISRTAWAKHGTWKHRQFGNEVQLRCGGLPHLALDLYRAEAQELFTALGEILSEPALLPHRLGRWERVKQWWARAVWNRRHHQELAVARRALVDEYTRRGPW